MGVKYGAGMKVRFEFYKGQSEVREMCGVQLKDRKKMHRFHVVFEGNNRPFGYGKQCSLVWQCVEERGWSCLEKGIGS